MHIYMLSAELWLYGWTIFTTQHMCIFSLYCRQFLCIHFCSKVH